MRDAGAVLGGLESGSCLLAVSEQERPQRRRTVGQVLRRGGKPLPNKHTIVVVMLDVGTGGLPLCRGVAQPDEHDGAEQDGGQEEVEHAVHTMRFSPPRE